MTDIAAIRAHARAQRQALPIDYRMRCGEQVAKRIGSSHFLEGANTVAAYLSNDAELPTERICELLWENGLACYLPVLRFKPTKQLLFARYERDTTLKPNRFGIPEPDNADATSIAPTQLDVVLVPLVAFDPNGNRIGMGGGFYDRTFAFKTTRSVERPTLVGLAYECQKLPDIAAQPWDVRLDAIVTETAIYEVPGTTTKIPQQA